MNDINELRRLALDGDLAAMQEIILRLEAAESECLEQARLNGMGSEREAALLAKLEAAEKERDALRAKSETAENDAAHQKALAASALRVAEGWERKCDTLRAKIEAMEKQKPECEVVGQVHNVLYEVRTLKYDLPAGTKLYTLPGAHPAPSVPREAIAKILTEVMNIAVSNGADSRSMPDEYVEVAAWLCGIPAQNAPSVPDGWKLVPRPPTPTMVKAGLESSHVLNVHRVLACYDAMIDAAPEAKP